MNLCKTINFLNKRIIYKIKNNFYKLKLFGIQYGKNLQIYGNVKIFGNRCNIKIGNNCSLNEGTILSANGKIIIGDNVVISSYSVLHTGKLKINIWPIKEHIYEDIVIENNVWIASHCIISGGVKIGKNVIIGANSFVNRNLESGYFYAGNPVKKICKIENLK
ncbi:acyltransferase [Nitrosophilus kaiyonis]|uniref:acyltransferase n=1 Tax=Nitrosophilus kaiyonis TaxID=2930200 RepID=UPI0024920CF7|nr:acyltransferase [Nitrosophilus kaiyonis]